jgi:hypothetical protein
MDSEKGITGSRDIGEKRRQGQGENTVRTERSV